MEHHEDVVLQQRVRTGPVVHPRRSRGEHVGRAERQEEEERGDDEHHHERPRDERVVEPLAISPHDERGVAGERAEPQQDAALERAPHRGDVEQQRRAARPDVLHVLQVEVVGEDRVHHHRSGDQAGRGGEPRIVRCGPQQAPVSDHGRVPERDRAEQRRDETDDQRRVPEDAVHARGDHARHRRHAPS